MENKNIDVPVGLIEAYEKVRLSGRTNMFDATAVANIMIEMGYIDEVIWLLEKDYNRVNLKKYSALLKAYCDVFKVTEILSN